MPERPLRIAIVGKPNSGKSSLFNQLTGLNQKIGNFPGVTVDKKVGFFRLPAGLPARVMDLPGVYSLYPRSVEERISLDILIDQKHADFPDKIILVADATNLKNCLLLLTQLIDLQLPVILALNMVDLATKSGQTIDVKAMAQAFDIPIVLINARQGQGIDELKTILGQDTKISQYKVYQMDSQIQGAVQKVCTQLAIQCPYRAYLLLQRADQFKSLSESDKNFLKQTAHHHHFFPGKYQGAETVQRFHVIHDMLSRIILTKADPQWKKNSYKIDQILTHKLWGYLIFFVLLFFIFQSLFTWAQAPMNMIDTAFVMLSEQITDILPAGPAVDLVVQGVLPGISGILIFIPQIAILFAFITILEETGYMARVVFIMDKIMRQFGLNGRSIVPLISGWACAIPAIMSARTIENKKDHLITIFIIPLMSCSARLPVFAILIAVVIPNNTLFGVVHVQGLVLMSLYMLGVVAAVLTALLLKKRMRTTEKSYLLLELPSYKIPRWKNVAYTVVEKTKTFVVEAGKIILSISIVLWALAHYGPAGEMDKAEQIYKTELHEKTISPEELDKQIAAYRLEHSYVGIIGKFIEPVIQPLGYDWKIGIALVTSFVAREAFVGTLATIYTISSVDEKISIQERLKREINPNTGKPQFTLATGLSLLIFYAFSMQCVSTLAIMKRETKGWKWPLLQLGYMSILAYISSLIVYQLVR